MSRPACEMEGWFPFRAELNGQAKATALDQINKRFSGACLATKVAADSRLATIRAARRHLGGHVQPHLRS